MVAIRLRALTAYRLVLPILQQYVNAGDFSLLGRLRTAVVRNFVYYTTVGVVAGILLVIIAIRQHLDGSGLVSFAMALSNAWGLLLVVLFLGYGLVEVPRGLWKQADRQAMLRSLESRATHFKDSLDDAVGELDEVLMVSDRPVFDLTPKSK